MQMNRILVRALLAAILAAIAAAPAAAQATGSITGLITDQSGAIVPGVSVEATNTATGIVRTTTSGADGFYSVPLVQPGRYTVKATLSGFKPVVREAVDVSVGDT